MIDLRTTLVSSLNTILPTYYELFVDSSTTLPIITYMQTNDIAQQEGDSIRYSTPVYTIKLWGNDISDLSSYASSIDTAMFNLGFKRIGFNELTYDLQICFIFKYLALCIEK